MQPGKEVGESQANYEAGQELHFPSGSGAAGGQPRRSSRRAPRARWGWNVAGVGGAGCWGPEPHALGPPRAKAGIWLAGKSAINARI